jgi:hypothetical protein
VELPAPGGPDITIRGFFIIYFVIQSK